MNNLKWQFSIDFRVQKYKKKIRHQMINPLIVSTYNTDTHSHLMIATEQPKVSTNSLQFFANFINTHTDKNDDDSTRLI